MKYEKPAQHRIYLVSLNSESKWGRGGNRACHHALRHGQCPKEWVGKYGSAFVYHFSRPASCEIVGPDDCVAAVYLADLFSH